MGAKGKGRKCSIFSLNVFVTLLFFRLVQSDFEPDCPRFYPTLCWGLFWIYGNEVVFIKEPTVSYFEFSIGKCIKKIKQDDSSRKAMEPAFSDFRRRKEINNACPACLKVVNFFQRSRSITFGCFLRDFWSWVMSWICTLTIRWTKRFRKEKTAVSTEKGPP